MTRKKLLLLGAALIFCAFVLHIGAMRPSEEALCRAEALDYLIAQGDPVVLETLPPFLEGDTARQDGTGLPPAEQGAELVGDRMLREEGRLYYVRPGGAELVVFAINSTE